MNLEANTCQCNIAHAQLHNLETSIVNWNEKNQLNGQERKSVSEVLNYFSARGESPLILRLRDRKKKYLPYIDDESWDCINFLLRSWTSFASTPEGFRKQFDAYWHAYAAVLFELLRKSMDNEILIPEKIHFHSPIPDALLQSGNWHLRRDIFEGLNQITLSLKDCQQWFDVRRTLMGNSFCQTYSGCYNEISKLDLEPIQDEALHSILLLVSIWCNMAKLYAKITGVQEIDETQYKLLNDEIFDITPYVVSFLEIALQNLYWEKLNPVKNKFKDSITRVTERIEADCVKNLLNQIIDQLSEALKRNTNDQVVRIYLTDIIEAFKITNIKDIDKDERLSPANIGDDLFREIKAINNRLHVISGTQEILQRDHSSILETIKKSRKDILEFYKDTNQKIISTIINNFDERDLNITKTILAKITHVQKFNENSFQQCLKTIKNSINEIKNKKLSIGNHPATKILKNFEDTLENPELNIKHKLEYCIPIIPLFLKYKGTIELKTGANIEKIWSWLKKNYGEI